MAKTEKSTPTSERKAARSIVMLPVPEVRPYEKNPRKNAEAVKYVKASIEKFGFKQPIIVDSNRVIIAGHTRLKAAQKLELAKGVSRGFKQLRGGLLQAYGIFYIMGQPPYSAAFLGIIGFPLTGRHQVQRLPHRVATGGLDLGSNRSAGEIDGHVQSLGKVTIAEELHGVSLALHKAHGAQLVLRHRSTGLEESLELAEVDNSDGGLEAGVVEALLRQTTVKGHLTTFEAGADGATGTSLLALVALAAGLAQAGAFAATEALLAMLGTGVGLKCLKCQHDGKING